MRLFADEFQIDLIQFPIFDLRQMSARHGNISRIRKKSLHEMIRHSCSTLPPLKYKVIHTLVLVHP
jgi:hypothetical protein